MELIASCGPDTVGNCNKMLLCGLALAGIWEKQEKCVKLPMINSKQIHLLSKENLAKLLMEILQLSPCF